MTYNRIILRIYRLILSLFSWYGISFVFRKRKKLLDIKKNGTAILVKMSKAVLYSKIAGSLITLVWIATTHKAIKNLIKSIAL